MVTRLSNRITFTTLSIESLNTMAASDAFSNIPDFQKPEFIRHLEEQQMKDSLKMYNHLVETCFDKCVTVGWGGVSVQGRHAVCECTT
jgi:hypothetical protein